MPIVTILCEQYDRLKTIWDLATVKSMSSLDIHVDNATMRPSVDLYVQSPNLLTTL